ncbi:IclR family transcriptional regulator [Arthrobacter sp. KK5.5]|uniref:IclR family transcriptional regulator n=1 Tax=Arthrobacter sp. KK5.5 TaxID=3373084 RepID=UPI003EE76516
MPKTSIVKRPEYAVESVDSALRLVVLLQERDWVRIGEAARELGVAPSTAHRLMATLVYRGFALQDEQRRYCAGPRLRPDAAQAATHGIVAFARPHLEALARSVRETVNLVERVGVTARFLSSAEGPQLLRIGDRTGTVLPAHTSSGGKAALASLPEAAVVHLYTGRAARRSGNRLAPAELETLQRELATIRARGYAVNLGRTEADIAAVGAVVGRTPRGSTLALSVGAPLSRAADIQADDAVAHLLATCSAVLADLQPETP